VVAYAAFCCNSFIGCGRTQGISIINRAGDGIFHSRWFNVLVVEFELFFGLWLVFGFLPKLTRLVAIGCFSTFTIVSLYKALSGEMSCGCFGSVEVNPWITMLLDLVIVTLLIFFRPCESIGIAWLHYKNLSKQYVKLNIFVVIWLIIASVVTFMMLSVKENDYAELGKEFIGAGGKKTILLVPDKWKGKKFPLLPYIEPIEIQNELIYGKWIVVLYHKNCPKCKEVIDSLIAGKTKNWIGIEVSPTKIESGINKVVKLRGIPYWDTDTPCEIFLVDGIVDRVEK
jgi:hypothetical protein